MLSKLLLYYNTLRYLRFRQFSYRVWYFLRSKLPFLNRISPKIKGIELKEASLLKLHSFIPTKVSYINALTFTFLNKQHAFDSKIDWNYSDYGKLWTYNLNYFDYLNQEDFNKEVGIKLIKDFILNYNTIIDAKEPFPTSLRIINWVKFLSINKVYDDEINLSLSLQVQTLLNNLEYHLLGNHLLENAFALYFASFYFKDNDLYSTADKLLKKELKEQILQDGSHFELSPMYHQIMLNRTLDCINLASKNNVFQDQNIDLLRDLAIKMLSFLQQITFRNGDIPLVNDCSNGIAASSEELISYGNNLGINFKEINLSDSGYRMHRKENYEIFVDFGQVGPTYQPGHAHSDSLSFILYLSNLPFIVDTGTSTYEKNQRRNLERSTSSHNTVQLEDYEQTQVWGGFRVAKRAFTTIIIDEPDKMAAIHNGYLKHGYIHKRSFQFNDNEIEIIDEDTNNLSHQLSASMHFHPSVSVFAENNIIKTSLANLYFEGNNSIELVDYEYSTEFNLRTKSTKAIIHFNDILKTKIVLN